MKSIEEFELKLVGYKKQFVDGYITIDEYRNWVVLAAMEIRGD